MITRDALNTEIREWINTRYHHLGRKKGVGVDCAGLIIGVAHAMGISREVDIKGYSPIPDSARMKGHLEDYLDRIEIAEVKIGDILFMRFSTDPQHLAFVSGHDGKEITYIIHAYSQVRKCVEHGFDGEWKKRTVAAYKFRGVE